MSNLPAGAERDPFAPYNVEEKVFKVDINAKGLDGMNITDIWI